MKQRGILTRRSMLGAIGAAITVRVRDAKHIAHEGRESCLVGRHLARQRQREQRPAVEAVLETQDARAPGRVPRDFDRVLDRFGAAVDEERFLRKSAWRQSGEPLGERHV